MKILITGLVGFVGSHFCEHILKNTDWEIIGLDCINYAGNLNRLTDMGIWEKEKHRVKFIWHDLRSPINEQIKKEIGEVDYILHMAAESHVDNSIADPMKFVMSNVVGTGNILQYARELPSLKRFIYFSTDEVFGPIEVGTHKEDQRHAPGNPYSATKAGAEDLCLSFANTYGLPIVITNTMNIFGPRQHQEKYIPMLIKKISLGETVTIHATPDLLKAGIRFYLNARNAADAVLFILKNTTENIDVKNPSQGRFNVVGEEELDNLTLAQIVADIIGKPLKYEMIDFHTSRKGHDRRYGLDGSKLKNLGFKFPKTFKESLKRTITWSLEPQNRKWVGLDN
jgi:dTDP-glucose 4,6-dehydratase